ncbi:MAG: fumarate hydratase [Sedimentisphaerales bacterium]|nr:fumarate hydratase [Sedimentisphaerales bacterium]
MKTNKNVLPDTDTLSAAILELVRRCSCELPDDVEKALRQAHKAEKPGSNAELTLSTFLENIEMARANEAPLCQDTGMPIFHIHHPEGISTRKMTKIIHNVLEKATKNQYLRPNAVDAVSGKNSGINVGEGFPQIFFFEWDSPQIEIGLMLKGGGSENIGIQYSLPYAQLDAGRDLEGVRRVVLDAVRKAEGKGCPPGILGVCIGGDRGAGYVESKKQLFRLLDDVNPVGALAELERRILNDANKLGIGPLGLGGESTLLGVKIGSRHRVPACFFVTVSYMCWEHRRRFLRIAPDGSYEIS